MQIDVAVDEVMSNIAHYAYPDGEGTVTVSIEEKENTVQIFFRDSGIPYDPLTAKAPDLSLSAEDRPIGGHECFRTNVRFFVLNLLILI